MTRWQHNFPLLPFLICLLIHPTLPLSLHTPRRDFINAAALLSTSSIVLSPTEAAFASELTPTLADRMNSEANLLRRPTFSLTLPDLTYDAKFAGTWDVTSKTLNVSAPCGIPLFGGQRIYDRARAEIGDPSADLNYRSRFIPNADGLIVADREFNVRQIASSSMGESAVLSMSTDRLPNELTLALQPNRANGTLFNVDMLTTGRKYGSEGSRQYYDEIGRYDLSSCVARISLYFSLRSSQRNVFETVADTRSITLKEVETITAYEVSNDPDLVVARQRSLVYLVPAQDPNSMEFKMWKYAANRPIDVRDYAVTYKRRETRAF